MDQTPLQYKNASKIFEGYKALGMVSMDKPFIVRYIEKLEDLRIVIPVGRYFHTYNSKLQLLETSHSTPEPIGAIIADSKHVFTSAGNKIYGWRHGHRWLYHTFGGHDACIHSLINFGQHLISIDADNVLRVIEISNGEITLEMPFGSTFTISCILHPSTYLNKVLLGSQQGSLQLWNVRTQKLIFTFKGWQSPLRTIEQAPAVDLVAIGLEDGLIIIHNIRYDETLLKFIQDWGPVIRISFRTDGPPQMATTSDKGHIAIWDLDKAALKCHKRDVHRGAINGCQFINGEPLMLTSSTDNSLKMWCFDDTENNGRILHQRDGHSSPPNFIRFYGSEDNQVLSVAPDSTFRCFSVWSERLNRSLGTASFNRKFAKKVGVAHDPNVMPPIVEFATESIRECEWDNVIARHKNLGLVTTWTTKKVRMGSHKLLHQRFSYKKEIEATAITLSSCGNFAIIGYNTGHIDKYNIQSGIFRLSYGDGKAHDSPVRGLSCDEVTRFLLSGDDLGTVKFWSFKKGELIHTLKLESSIQKFYFHKESSLLAIALSDFTVRVIDIDTKRIIRNLPSHGDRINDLTMSYNSKWLIVASNESSIRTWDLALGKLIDWFKMPNPCTSLSMSPNGEYLALSLEKDLGIFIFTNLSVFFPLSLRPILSDFIPMINELPSVRKDDDDNEHVNSDDEGSLDGIQADAGKSNDSDAEMIDLEYKSPDQISSELITLSSLPTSRWKNLLNLDLIKLRNKPKEPPQKPKDAPFFLPTLDGLEPDFALDTGNEDQDDKSQVVKNLISMSPFGQVLLSCSESDDCSPLIKKLKKMTPNEIDTEIRSLDVQRPSDGENDFEEHYLLQCFLNMMKLALEKRQDFELIHSYLAVFLKVHSNTILQTPELLQVCEKLLSSENHYTDLQDKFDESLFIINFIRGIV